MPYRGVHVGNFYRVEKERGNVRQPQGPGPSLEMLKEPRSFGPLHQLAMTFLGKP